MIVFNCSGCCESAPKLEACNPNPQCCLHGQAQPYPATPFFFNICFIRSPDQQIGFLSDQQITAPDPADQPQQTGHIGQISRPADRSYRAYRNAHGFIRSIRSADRTPSVFKILRKHQIARRMVHVRPLNSQGQPGSRKVASKSHVEFEFIKFDEKTTREGL